MAKADTVGSTATAGIGRRLRRSRQTGTVLCLLLVATLAASCLSQQGTPTPSGSYDVMLMSECMAEATQHAEDRERHKAEFQSKATEPADPRWYEAELVDARSGQTFTLERLKGKIVMVETMAVWCGLCLQQQMQVRDMLDEGVDEVAFVSLDVDPNESAEVLAGHAVKYRFDWRFAIAPQDVSRALRAQFGSNVLNPPAVPVILIDGTGQARLLPLGVKPVAVLDEEIAAVGGR